jgi:MYXO-CTERM domain-containing protein
MPWEEEVDEVPLQGAPIVLSNRTAEIDALLAAYNDAAGFNQDGCEGCRVEPDDGRERWALGVMVLVLGAGVAARRRRSA